VLQAEATHPRYGPNVLRQIFTCLERSKERERKFGIDEEVTGEVTKWLRLQNENS